MFRVLLISGTMVVLATILAVGQVDDSKTEKKTIAEPPFPRLTEGQKTGRVLKLVSEVIDHLDGYQTNEEYLDFDRGVGAHVISNGNLGQRVAYVDIKQSGLTYTYWPYDCKVFKNDEIVFESSDDYKMQFSLHRERNGEKNTFGEIRLFGGVAIWARVKDLNKRYSKSVDIFSTSKNVVRPAHVWEAKFRNDDIARLYFMDANYESGDELKDELRGNMRLDLEVIQILRVSKEGKEQVIRTFNIITRDWIRMDEKINNLLQIPVGYGCPGAIASGNSYLDNFVHVYGSDHEQQMIEFEVTKTWLEIKVDGTSSGNEIQRTQTVNVQYFSTEITPRDQHVEMLRVRDSDRDLKLVSFRHLSVKYLIDFLRGYCSTLNIDLLEDDPLTRLFPIDQITKQDLNLTPQMIRYLLGPPDGPEFIKESVPINGASIMKHFYYERSIPWPLNLNELRSNNWYDDSITKKLGESGQFARIVRNFVQFDEQSFALESVTIWVLDKQKRRILKSYHLGILNQQQINSYHQQAKLLDISEECYINDNEMKSGRDYVWLELFYPSSSRNNELLARNELQLKEQFYHSILDGENFKLNVLRLPRIELMFGDEGFEVRMLMLDMPPIENIYSKTTNRFLEHNQDQDDLVLLAPDVQHCGQMCKVHYCKAFSYCHATRDCVLLGPKSMPVLSKENTNPSTNAQCSVYMLPDSLSLDELHQASLHSMISKLQFHDYSDLNVPQVPEELSLSPEEGGLDPDAWRDMFRNYQQDLLQSLIRNGHKLNELVFVLHPANLPVVLMPSKFVIENDPLDSFDLVDRETLNALQLSDSASLNDNLLGNSYNSEQIGDYFRQGLAASNYKFFSFPENLRRQVRKFSDLSYDQCALACLDTKCGSFSYCPSYKDCTLTSLNSTMLGQKLELISKTEQCFIAERDFLRNFYHYPNVFRPQMYQIKLDSPKTASSSASVKLTPSNCALECVSSTSFRCMSFQICHLDDGTSSCFLQTHRHPQGILSSGIKTRPNKAPSSSACDHYERSYLADFNQIEYRQIDQAELAKLTTSTYTGKTSFQCADICANELPDCSGFQFCFRGPAQAPEEVLQSDDVEQSEQPTVVAMQTCTMIQGKPSSTEEANELGAIVDEKNQGQLLKSGKFIKPSESCHLFSLRATSSEAHLRDLALANVVTLEESQLNEDRKRQLNETRGLSLKACFMLFLSVTTVSMALGFGVCLARERNEFVRQKLERARLLLGI